MLQDALITAVKIADGNVTTAKIADANVTTAKLADLNVTLGKMAANSVDASKIVDLSVGTAELANLGVTSGKLAGSALTNHVVSVAHAATAFITNASTVTWVTAVTTSQVLPAGTWDVVALFATTFLENTGVGCVGAFRVGAPIVGTTVTQTQAAADRTTALAFASGSVVSDGVTATVFTGEFRKTSGGTPRVENAAILATCRRSA
jgi:hypothetical protein